MRIVRLIVVLASLSTPALAVGASEPPPKDAIPLFDGKDTSHWVTRKGGKPCPWNVLPDGSMEIVPGKGDIDTKEKFGDCRLHVEFWIPKLPPDVKGQARGNSGVYLQQRYEIQVLDSYGLQPDKGDCGAIYSQKAPTVNACKPPEQWQTYDIYFEAPKYAADGTKTKNGVFRVVQNDQVIHDSVEVTDVTGGGEVEKPGDWPLRLQDHGNKVRYRNIWIVPINRKAQKDEKAEVQRWKVMNYGSLISATFEDQQHTGQFSEKGIAIKVGTDKAPAGMIFDAGLLRWSSAWTDGFVRYTGVAFDGAHGPMPSPLGTVWFGTREHPGVSLGTDFSDPRKEQYSPLPREFGHYNGLYRSGDRVVLSYDVGDCRILELPGSIVKDNKVLAFTRTMQIAPSVKPVLIDLADYRADGTTRPATTPSAPSVFELPRLNVTIVGAPEVQPLVRDGAISIEIPPHEQPMTFAAVLSNQPNPPVPERLESPEELCKGGPARWPTLVQNSGKLGTGDGPYVVDTITVPEENPYNSWMRIGGMDFFSDGRAAVCTWSGDVWVVSGIDEKLDHVVWKRYAAGLFQTLGLRIVNDTVYVLGRDQITRLIDLNNDGEADFYENFNNDVITAPSFHEFAFDLQTDPQGNFYYAKAGAVNPGGRGWQRITPHNGCVFKISPDGKNFEVFATGLRAPNGMSAGPHGELTVSDNEGTWVPTSRLNYIHKGDFLGVADLAHTSPKPANWGDPIFWLPHENVDNSSGGAVWVTTDKWGPFKDRLLHLSYGTCSMFLVMDENIDGIVQGAAVKFPNLSFDSGIMRARVNPIDGQVYVAGLKGWQTTAARDACFQRVRYTGKPVRMPTSLHVRQDGIEIGFTVPVDSETAGDPDSYSVEQWNYVWSEKYGSPEISTTNPAKQGHDVVVVKAAEVSADHRSVKLKIANLRPVMQMKISMKVDSEDKQPIEYDIYGTINKVPGQPQPVAGGATTEPSMGQ